MNNGDGDGERWTLFAVAVKQRRIELGLSQQDVAARTGMKSQQWSRYEKGSSPIRRGTVLTIAGALNWNNAEALKAAGFKLISEENDLENIILRLQLIAFQADRDGLPSETAMVNVQQRLNQFQQSLSEAQKAIAEIRKTLSKQ